MATISGLSDDEAVVTSDLAEVQRSHHKGAGQDTMMAFISQHLASILRPFADHVDELHLLVTQLRCDLTAVESKTVDQQAQLDHHEGLVQEHSAELYKQSGLIEVTQTAIKKINCEQAELESDHRNTKTGLASVHVAHDSTVRKVEALQELSKGTTVALQQLKMDLGQTDFKLSKNVEPALRSLKQDTSKLESDQQDTSRLLERTRVFGESCHEELQAVKQAIENQKAKDVKIIANINSNVSHLSSSLRETDARLQTQVEHLKIVNSHVKGYKHTLDSLEANQRAHQSKQEATTREIQENLNKHEELCRDFYEFKKDIGGDMKMGPNIKETVANLLKVTSNSAIQIREREIEAQSHIKRIDSSDSRQADLEARIQKVEDQANHIGSQIGLDTVKKESLVKADRIALAIKNWTVIGRQEATRTRLELQGKDLEKAKAALTQTTNNLESTAERVSTMETELRSINQKITKINAGLETTQEYWKGLSAGFKETHREAQDMIQTKSTSLSATMPPRLPAIPKSGARTPDVCSSDILSMSMPARVSSHAGAMTAR